MLAVQLTVAWRALHLQVRWATVLYRMMARMKSKVSITVAWKPLYQCVRDAYMEPLNTYTGTIRHHLEWLGPLSVV